MRALFSILVLLVVVTTAHADERDKARASFRLGSQHYSLGEYREALVAFKEAYRSYEDPSFLFNIAQCERQLDQRADAIRAYRMYLVNASDAANRDEVRALITRLEHELSDERATKAAPPPGVQPPTTGEAHPIVASTPSPALTLTAAPPPRHDKPAYKKWWVWTIVGVAVAGGVAAGLAVSLTHNSGTTPTAADHLRHCEPLLMRAFIINSACALLLVAGCGSKSSMSLVVVSVDADTTIGDVASLHVRATIGATTREFDVRPTGGSPLSIPPAQTFGIDIPRSLTGSVDLHVDAHDATDAVVASGDGSGPINLGGRADLTIHLAGSAGGDGGSSDDMGGVSDLAGPTGDMVVIPPALLTIDKTTQSFGDIVIGKTSTTASFLVVNDGGMPTSVATLMKSGANLGEFTIDTTDCGPALNPGARCHVTASVTPTTAGMKTASFTLTATQGGSVGGTLTANALTPGAVKIQQPSGNCGSSIVGTLSATTASFTVNNSGSSATTALSVSTSDAQFAATGCNGMVLSAGGSCTITVKFTPSMSGTQNASLTVSATTGGTDTASLVGVGLKPAALSVAPGSYGFNPAARGSSGDSGTFTVSNAGDVSSATMSAATLSGTNAASFAISADNCKNAPVGPAPAHCTIIVQFKPQVSGSNTATLNVTAGATSVGTPPLSGTGTPIWVAESPPSGTPKLTSVWATDKQHVYAVGNAGTILFRGTNGTWTAQSLGVATPADLTAVSGAASTNVFVAGDAVYQSNGGGTWNSQNSQGPLTGVWAFSSADIWAAWDDGSGDPNTGDGVYHYTPANGWAFARDSGNNALHGSTHVWGTSSSDLFIFGGFAHFQISSNSFVSTGTIYHLSGAGTFTTQFSQNSQISPAGSSLAIRSLWGTGSPANNLYAVTSNFGFGLPKTEVILHSSGDGAWNSLPPPAPTVECDAVWGYDASHVFFGCADGVHSYDGTTWSSSLASASQFFGISGSNVGSPDVFAVGVASDGTTGVV